MGEARKRPVGNPLAIIMQRPPMALMPGISYPPSEGRWHVDREAALFDPAEVGPQKLEVYDTHDAFHPPRSLTKAQRRELAIKQAALRIAARMETRSFRALAEEIGCSHQAIDKALITICERIGIRKFMISDSRRQKLSDSRKRFLGQDCGRSHT